MDPDSRRAFKPLHHINPAASTPSQRSHAQSHAHTQLQLGISYDVFVRTTQPAHAEVVAQVLERVWDNDVYKAAYSGWYCVGCEEYKDELELGPSEAGGSLVGVATRAQAGQGVTKAESGSLCMFEMFQCRASTHSCIPKEQAAHALPQRSLFQSRRSHLHDPPDTVPAQGGGQLLLCTVQLPAAA